MTDQVVFKKDVDDRVSERRSAQLQASLVSCFVHSARGVFPINSVVDAMPDDQDRVILQITWLQLANPEGVRTYSDPVRIVIGSKALDRYCAMTMQGRRRAIQNFQRWLRERRAGHVPQQHSRSKAILEWTIRFAELTESRWQPTTYL